MDGNRDYSLVKNTPTNPSYPPMVLILLRHCQSKTGTPLEMSRSFSSPTLTSYYHSPTNYFLRLNDNGCFWRPRNHLAVPPADPTQRITVILTSQYLTRNPKTYLKPPCSTKRVFCLLSSSCSCFRTLTGCQVLIISFDMPGNYLHHQKLSVIPQHALLQVLIYTFISACCEGLFLFCSVFCVSKRT